jgi:glycosyltransferase involved in cell wall biosynthesis
MNAADVLLVTSSHEGGPLVVREALACNLPIVSVDVGDVRKRISNLQGCVLCENNRATTIAEALVRVLERSLRVDGRDAISDMNQTDIARRIISVYEQALRGKSQCD